jgi:SnoaL-like protein
MASNAPRQVVERYLRAVNQHDMATARQLMHPDFEDFYPQSGELTRGSANLEAIFSNYPGEMEGLGQDRIVGGEDQFVRSPLFTIIRVEGSEEALTGIQRAKYPDGSVWYIILLVELRDGLIYRTQTFFAPTFEPPAWRARWVEIRPRPGT